MLTADSGGQRGPLSPARHLTDLGKKGNRLGWDPRDTGDFAELSPAFRPGIAPIIAAIEIPISATRQDDVRIGRLHMDDPYGRGKVRFSQV